MRKWNANILTSHRLKWLSCVYLTPSISCQCRVMDAHKSMARPAWTPSFAERAQHTMLRSCSRRPSPVFAVGFGINESIMNQWYWNKSHQSQRQLGFKRIQIKTVRSRSVTSVFSARLPGFCSQTASTLPCPMVNPHTDSPICSGQLLDRTSRFHKLDKLPTNWQWGGCTSYCLVFE